MNTFTRSVLVTLSVLTSPATFAGVMNPGEAKGQLIYLSEEDVRTESPKFRALSPLSIPVFAELPMELAVVAGAVTLKQQSLLSHIQLKSRARGTPNLDLSDQPGGVESPILKPHPDGAWVHMVLTTNGEISITPSTETDAVAFHAGRRVTPVRLVSDLTETRILRTDELGWQDFSKVGSKAANYGELARYLNSPERSVVRPGFAVPFHYYAAFLAQNPAIRAAIERVLRDPLMRKVANVEYRAQKLKVIRDSILTESSVIDGNLVNELIHLMDSFQTPVGVKRKMKFRSSTNAEDLPNFNGAGLYQSAGYKPIADGVERSRPEKEAVLRKTLRTVWSSVWTLRAYEERSLFGIPHGEVMMGMQVNPSFTDEGSDGVVVTKNIAQRPDLAGPGVYVESQRGDHHSVANPEPGVHPERVLILYDALDPLNPAKYRLHVLQRSNVADDTITVLPHDNPNPVMTETQIKDLVFHSIAATRHFRRIFAPDRADFALDLEFKVDSYETGTPAVYLKQARPYIE